MRLKNLRKVKIKQRLLVSFIIISVLPLALFGVYTYSKANGAIRSKISSYSVQVMDQVCANITLQLEDLESMSDSFVISETIQNAVENYSSLGDSEVADAQSKIMDMVNGKIAEYPAIRNIEIQSSTGADIYTLGFGNMKDSDKKRLSEMAKENAGKVYWTYCTFDNKASLAMARQINNTTGTKAIGYIYILVDESYLKNVYKDINIGTNSDVFIMGSDGMVLSSSSRKIPMGSVIKEKGFVKKVIGSKNKAFDFKYSGDKKLVSSASIKGRDMYLAGLIPYKYINSEAGSIKYGMIFLLVICILFSILFAYVISMSISTPLKRLIFNMEKVEKGQLDGLTEDSADDEIADVSKSFGKMISKISIMIEKIRNASDNVMECSSSIYNCAGNAGNAAEQISVSMNEVSRGAYSQTNEISSEVTLISRLSDEIDTMVEDIGRISADAAGLKGISRSATDTVIELSGKTKTMSRISEVMVENINRLGTEMKEIRNVVKVISKISEQTNLLALNAAIEASKAGEQGKGFSVIASEIRKLSEQVKQESSHINNIILKHLELVQGSVAEIRKTSDIAEEQETIVARTRDAFNNIHEGLSGIIRGIDSIKSVSDTVYDIKDKTLTSIESVSAVSQQTSALSEEVGAATEEQLGIFTKLVESTEELKETTVKLEESIAIFNTR
ncbi:MAG TPA: methyl-accepting chemotaxis protein [Ruminiclostridium sp.]|nr:methyl-accepting chemotaxis protein [Ruminiclostridium sp.]